MDIIFHGAYIIQDREAWFLFRELHPGQDLSVRSFVAGYNAAQASRINT